MPTERKKPATCAPRATACSRCSATPPPRWSRRTTSTWSRPWSSASSPSTRWASSKSSARSSDACVSRYRTRACRASRRSGTSSTKSSEGARDPRLEIRTRRDAMSNDTLKEQLRSLVAEIAEKDEIPDEASFKDLGIDSMMGVEIVAAIERQYQIKVADDELSGFKDLVGAYAIVVKKLEAKDAIAAAE